MKYTFDLSLFNLNFRYIREYEHAIDTMQNDIENLEKENSDLKEKLRAQGKKTLFDGLLKPPGWCPFVDPRSKLQVNYLTSLSLSLCFRCFSFGGCCRVALRTAS